MQPIEKKFWLTPLILIIIIVLLHLFATQTAWVEDVYTAYIFPVISTALRLITQWIPFSFGDVLYALAFAWVLIKLILFFRRKPTWRKFLFSLRNLLVKCLWIYIFFLVAWGLNYYHYGIGDKLKIVPAKYSTEDLKAVTSKLLIKLNANRKLIDSLHINYADNNTTLKEAEALYNNAKSSYPFLAYHFPDVKKMMFGVVGNYSGFLGYYNPFTGEAQVNTQIPPFIIPFTACHEIGHQLGFASESEASFVGYLVEQKGHSPVFDYSTYFDLFGYANGELYSRDSVAAKQNAKLLDTLVKKDYITYRKWRNAGIF